MTGLLNKKWKVVSVKTDCEKLIIAPINWKCSCDTDDSHYKRNGCSCHVGNLYGIDVNWNKREVLEHVVALHNASIDN